MKPTRLAALTRTAPRCASFDEEESVRAYEREMRVHRAHTEAYEVVPLEERVDGAYRVRGSGGSYLVDLVDGTGEADSCTCPDFLTNDLGTCKHLEAARRALGKGLRAELAAVTTPDRPTVAVRAVGGLALVLRGKATRSLLKRAGWAQDDTGKLEPLRPEAISQPPSELRVVHAALAVHERIVSRAALEARNERVRAAVDRRTLGLDALAVPLAPYQREGVAHLVTRGRAVIADDLGLGKGLQALGASEVLCAHGEADRVLIVTPEPKIESWARDIERLTGKRAAVASGDDRRRRSALASGARYKVASYETVTGDLDSILASPADILVLDQAQRARNFRARVASALRAIPSRFVFVLTGLPVDRHLDDLYALLQLVDPDLLSPLWKFNLLYYRQGKDGQILGYKNLPRLRATLGPLIVRRRKEDVLAQLEPVHQQLRVTALSPAQRKVESEARREAARIAALGAQRPLSAEEQAAGHAAIERSLRAACSLLLVDPAADGEGAGEGSTRIEELEHLVEEICQQGPHRVIVCSRWPDLLSLAATRLEASGVGCVTLDPNEPEARRLGKQRVFRDSDEARVLFVPDSLATAAGFLGAGYLVHLDLPTGPDRQRQRLALAHRVGQTRGVTEILLRADTGLERLVEGRLRAGAITPSMELSLSGQGSLDAIAPLLTGAAPASLLARPGGTPVPPPTDLGAPRPADLALVARPPAADSSAGPPAVRAPRGLVIGLSPEPPAVIFSPSPPTATLSPMPPAVDVPPRTAAVPPLVLADLTDLPPPTPRGPLVLHIDPPPRSLSATSGTVPEAWAFPPPRSIDSRTMDAPGPSTQRTSTHDSEVPWPLTGRAHDRIRLAQIVLGAGFPGDATRAAYAALAVALYALLRREAPSAPRRLLGDHPSLVAALFRHLVPTGRLPTSAHTALARLHDLAQLDEAGVAVDASLAREAVDEARGWVERLCPQDADG